MPGKILLFEDEVSIRSVLYELLTDAGYEVAAAGDGVTGLAQYRRESFDLVLLDIMMPRMDGYAVCRAIRENSDTPVIMLTALDEEEAQVKAFELKVDDYITKPFSLKLLLLRVEAVLRRNGQKKEQGQVFRFGELVLEVEEMRVFRGGEEISLTKIEFELLKLFMENPGRVFTRDNLLNQVWGYDFCGEEKAVNIHIMNLRRKLHMDCIETIRGVGYRFAKN
ncbi:MAG: response regulator transcription factor [Lachnospiraceae bacterium]|mgnify:CR=1 FL=1|nr:response regulator transcription factor [Lachnospiraceae bacterium]